MFCGSILSNKIKLLSIDILKASVLTFLKTVLPSSFPVPKCAWAVPPPPLALLGYARVNPINDGDPNTNT